MLLFEFGLRDFLATEAAALANPLFPASGLATGSFNGLHPQSKFLAFIQRSILPFSAQFSAFQLYPNPPFPPQPPFSRPPVRSNGFFRGLPQKANS